jgi:hypothetical protein
MHGFGLQRSRTSILHDEAYWSRRLMGILATGSWLARQSNRTQEKKIKKIEQYIPLKGLTQKPFASLIDQI